MLRRGHRDEALRVYLRLLVSQGENKVVREAFSTALQSEGAVFELRAERIRAPQHFERFAEAWEQKYGRRPMNESVEETYLFRLTAR